MVFERDYWEGVMAPAAKHSHKEQEQLILDAAVECIQETSLLDFTMSAISKAAGMSMGSIYKHVQCKEDIIFALATRGYRHQSAIFSKVLALPLTTPEKFIGLTLLCPKKTKLYDFDSHLESFATNELIIKRTSAHWAQHMISAHENCESIFSQCMHQAVTSGELNFDGNIDEMIEEINLSCWALHMGFQQVERVIQVHQIAEETDSLQDAVPLDAVIIKSVTRLLNSYDWQKPLDSDGVLKVANLLQQHSLR